VTTGPFTLTEREQAEVDQARLETNPALYPDSRTAILTGALERAVRTVGPLAGGEWTEADYATARSAILTAYHDNDIAVGHLASFALDAVKYRLCAPLVLAPAEPQPDAPTNIADLPAYWDERRAKQGKPDKSRCAAELRIALAMLVGDKPYKQGFSDGFTRGVEYGRALAALEKP
jgi:hypothetical protein